jgi:hypothetical protein
MGEFREIDEHLMVVDPGSISNSGSNLVRPPRGCLFYQAGDVDLVPANVKGPLVEAPEIYSFG